MAWMSEWFSYAARLCIALFTLLNSWGILPPTNKCMGQGVAEAKAGSPLKWCTAGINKT